MRKSEGLLGLGTWLIFQPNSKWPQVKSEKCLAIAEYLIALYFLNLNLITPEP